MTAILTDDARCLTCGYMLRDLPAPQCPECGRAFDPDDPKTFECLATRRRRRTRRIVLAVGLLLLAVAFAPRGVDNLSLTFTCPDCGHDVAVTRWQAVPPGWIPWRYPGFFRSEELVAAGSTTSPSTPCAAHKYKVVVSKSGRQSASAWGGTVVYINGHVTTPDTAPAVLEGLMAPGVNGLMIMAR